ncbi:flavodoxin family protein [Mogibacterium sp.]|uniref:flavodoxin family protein n=1 Tax=Mogibacterium sp. TaxID=2049035 RepID=UPI002ED3BB2A
MDESNTLVGEFMCQGKMQQAVRDRYVKMKAQPDAAPNLDQLIDNFDRACPIRMRRIWRTSVRKF